jgi:hypothetical protein
VFANVRIVRDRRHLDELQVRAFLDGGLVVAVLDLIERRRLIQQRAGDEEWVLPCRNIGRLRLQAACSGHQ